MPDAPVWEKLESLICGYLDEVTLTSLLDGGAEIGGCPSVKSKYFMLSP